MAKTEMRFKWGNDESCEVYVADAFVGDITYDTYGWNGMAEVRDILSSIARVQGWEILVSGEPAI